MPQLQIFLPDDSQINHDLTEDKVTVGRLADNTLQVDDGSVSSHHAELVFEGEKYHLHDLGSTNGTFVNGEQITDVILNHGDEIRFGQIGSVFTSSETEHESQPLPESSIATVEVAKQSARPATFVSTSPVPKNVKKKDPLAAGLYVLAVVAILAFGGAVAYVFTMQTGL